MSNCASVSMPPADEEVRISTDVVPGRDRYSFWRDVVCRTGAKTDFDTVHRDDFKGAVRVRSVGSVNLIDFRGSQATYFRSRSICSTADDRFFLIRRRTGRGQYCSPESEGSIPVNGFIHTHATQAGSLHCEEGGEFQILHVPGLLVRPMITEAEAIKGICGPDSPEVRLLTGYVDLVAGAGTADAAMQSLIARHIADLFVAATRPASDVMQGMLENSARAAKLRLAKAWIEQELSYPRLNAARVGAKLSVSGRTVQSLFEAEGRTFSEYVRERRLQYALRKLRDPRCTQRISQIAFEAGFVDLSHFNRCFRGRFGDTPSGVRSTSL